MISKYKILSVAALCIALSPLTYAGGSVSCENLGDDKSVLGGSSMIKIPSYSPRCMTNGRVDVPDKSYLYIDAVSTKNQTPFYPDSPQTVGTNGLLHVIRNVRNGRDSLYFNKAFSGNLSFIHNQNAGKTHQFFAKVASYTETDLMNKAYVKVTLRWEKQ